MAGELAKEYRAITDAGILVQIDDPFLPDIFFDADLDRAQMKRRAEIYVEATNSALKGIPPSGCFARLGSSVGLRFMPVQ